MVVVRSRTCSRSPTRGCPRRARRRGRGPRPPAAS
jgi:hypothetical protein